MMRKLVLFIALLASFTVHAREERSPESITEEKNKDAVRRFYEEVWNKGNLDVADEIFADDYVRHDPRGGQPPAGARGQKLIAQNFRKQCPDCVMKLEPLLADRDYVIGRWTIRGNHTPSGNDIDFVGVNIFRFSDGKVVEIWNHRDDLAFSLQTGRVTKVDQPSQPSPR